MATIIIVACSPLWEARRPPSGGDAFGFPVRFDWQQRGILSTCQRNEQILEDPLPLDVGQVDEANSKMPLSIHRRGALRDRARHTERTVWKLHGHADVIVEIDIRGGEQSAAIQPQILDDSGRRDPLTASSAGRQVRLEAIVSAVVPALEHTKARGYQEGPI